MRLWPALALLLIAAPAEADDVSATAPVDVSVTIYRSPQRNGGSMQLGSLGGFAVVTETRRVALPAGRARLRFEGVADGIIPESAIITGLPGGVIEKNRDAALLSPSALLRASLRGTMQLRRTNPTTGKTSLVNATLVSADQNGITVRTPNGIEALRCDGMPETLTTNKKPTGLSAQPTLSVSTRTGKAVTALVKLTYIAENFDWAANYTAAVAANGKTFDLTGWITLANGNSVSLKDAQVMIVAGGLNRSYLRRYINYQPRVLAQCWPMQRTSDIPLRQGRPYELARPYLGEDYERYSGRRLRKGMMEDRVSLMSVPMAAIPSPPPPPPPPPPAPVAEQLGDLKLYRVPLRTTVAAMQMKQTRLVAQDAVSFERVLRTETSVIAWGYGVENSTPAIIARTTNDKLHKLGLPLPAGEVMFMQDHAGRPMLIGSPSIRDTATDEKIELTLGNATDLSVSRRLLRERGTNLNEPQITPEAATLFGSAAQLLEVTVSNASPLPAPFELVLQPQGFLRVVRADAAFVMRDGKTVFALTIPANGKTVIHYAVDEKR